MARSDRLLDAIMDALLAGGVALVASCGGEGKAAEPADGGVSDAPVFPAVPPGALGCRGVGRPGYYGPCCMSLYCFEPAALGGRCPEGASLESRTLTGVPGSGGCGCGDVGGPYQGEPGNCCYTAGVSSCLGRPFLVRGEARRAQAVPGTDWVSV